MWLVRCRRRTRRRGCRPITRPAAYRGGMTAADVELLIHPAQVHLPSARSALFDAANELGGDERISMDAEKPIAEFLFQVHQRVLDQVLLIRRADDDVLAVGKEVNDFGHRYQPDIAA